MKISPKISYARLVDSLNNYRVTDKGCHEFQGDIAPNGYGRISIRGIRHGAHRVVYEICNGIELVTDDVVMHQCDNPKCINPEHLTLGTLSLNFLDMWEKGRAVIVSGERHGMCATKRLARLA